MKIILKILQVVYALYAFVLFVLLMFVVVFLSAIGSLFGRIKGGNFIFRLCSIWADAWFFLIGIYHKNVFIAPHTSDHACIFVANHISYMDVPVLVKSVRQPIRVLAKEELSKIPVFGFIYKRATVMVNRSSVENRARSVQVLKTILRKRISVFIYPEGTFNTTGQPLKEFYNGAFRIAIETQTPIKPVVFPYTIDRLHYDSIFSLTPGKSVAVFMEEVPVNGLTLEDVDYLKQKVYELMDAELRKWRKYEEAAVESS